MNRTLGTAALGVSLCLLAGAFGLRALYVLGIALALLALAAAASVRLGAWRVRLTRDPDRATVEEGAPLHLTLHLRGRTLPLGAGPRGCVFAIPLACASAGCTRPRPRCSCSRARRRSAASNSRAWRELPASCPRSRVAPTAATSTACERIVRAPPPR